MGISLLRSVVETSASVLRKWERAALAGIESASLDTSMCKCNNETHVKPALQRCDSSLASHCC